MLSDVSTTELENLLTALREGRVRVPLTALALDRIGADGLRDHVAALAPFNEETLAALLRAVLDERARRPPTPELVWTGPEGPSATARRTEVIVRHLFASAERDVWMAGYSIDHGGRIFAPLHDVMKARGVRARFLLHPQYERGEARAPTVETGANLILHRFLERNWPFGAPTPELYYDPRPLEKKPRASMHIKAVVVDETRVLIGSANFTDAGHERNYEAGAYLEDPAFAKRLVRQLRSLVEGGLVHRYG
ncbi:MAG: DISARM system phospholipase D-like protein DrmC [Sandaracinaceae bacterium]